MKGLLVVPVALLFACSQPNFPSVSREEAASDSVVFRDVSVFDGERMLRHQDVFVTGGEITAVVATGSVSVSPEALEISGAGRTLLPGLVDSHAHFFSAGEKDMRPPSPDDIAEAFLFAGVTTVLVAAGFDEVTELARDRASGDAIAPHLFSAGPGLTAPGGHPAPLFRAMLPWPISSLAVGSILTAGNADEARAAVSKVAEMKLELMKIVYDDLPPGSPHLSNGALTAAVAEARALGMRAIVHATTPEDAIAATEAGAALLVHVPQRGAIDSEQLARLVGANVPVVTTVRMISASHELAAQGPSPLESSMFDSRFLQPWQDEPAWALEGFSEEIDERWAEVAEDTRANFRALYAAGVQIFVGTDSGVHGVFPGASLHREIETLVELGMPALQVLRSATSAPADFLDPKGTFGRIAPGQRADLLLVRGDPSVDIDALSEIDEVFLAGARLSRTGGGESGWAKGRAASLHH